MPLHDGGSPRSSAGLDIGDLAPALALPDLGGQTVDLADFRAA
jgi:hypothetical protein